MEKFILITACGSFMSEIYTMNGLDFETQHQSDAKKFDSYEEAQSFINESNFDKKTIWVQKIEIMKKVNTTLGTAEIKHASIRRAHGYGQYKITVQINLEGEDHELTAHSTDSELFDKVHGEDNEFETLMEEASMLIEREVEDYVNSL